MVIKDFIFLGLGVCLAAVGGYLVITHSDEFPGAFMTIVGSGVVGLYASKWYHG